MSHLQRELEFNGRKITLVGTAHVSAESIKEVETLAGGDSSGRVQR